MKALLITLILTSIAFFAACSGVVEKESAVDASVNADGSCTQDFTDSYSAVYTESNILEEKLDRKLSSGKILNQAQTLKMACDNFFTKHNNINCKIEVDHQKVKITSASLVNKCEMARQILESSQNPNN